MIDTPFESKSLKCRTIPSVVFNVKCRIYFRIVSIATVELVCDEENVILKQK